MKIYKQSKKEKKKKQSYESVFYNSKCSEKWNLSTIFGESGTDSYSSLGLLADDTNTDMFSTNWECFQITLLDAMQREDIKTF